MGFLRNPCFVKTKSVTRWMTRWPTWKQSRWLNQSLGIGEVQSVHASDQICEIDVVLPQARMKPRCWNPQWKSRRVIDELQQCAGSTSLSTLPTKVQLHQCCYAMKLSIRRALRREYC